jgi:small-conductance mechanosensitive channel
MDKFPASSAAHATTGQRKLHKALSKTKIGGLAVLFVMLLLCLLSSWMTRDAVAYLSFLRSQNNKKPLVDLSAWQTIQVLAPMAISTEERGYANDATRLADHEIDQSYALMLRLASLQARHRTLTGQALVLSQKVTQLEQIVKQDQLQVTALSNKPGTDTSDAKNGAASTAGNDDLEVAKAQLDLDSDELADAQRDLNNLIGDNSDRIQAEYKTHEASVHQKDSPTDGNSQGAVLSAKRHKTLFARIQAWRNQRERYQLLQQALQQTQANLAKLTTERNAQKAKFDAAKTEAKNNATDRAAWLDNVKDKTIARQILSIYDDRIQTNQQLADVYGKWSAQVLLQHRIVLHMITQSLALIATLLICMIVLDTLVRRLMAHAVLDRRQAHTLRSILDLSIQLIGTISILLIVFGVPQQTTTILGLSTAALTIVLQDFVLAFFGWFVLMGKNGIHVGDWVEINGVGGEVVEVGLISTTLLETGDLADQGYPTGRRISFINSFAIRGQFFNFSTTGQWMWDEIAVSLPPSADLRATTQRIHQVVAEETGQNARAAEQDWKLGSQGVSLNNFSAASTLSTRPSANGIDIGVRYVTRAAERFELRNRLYLRLIELLQDSAPSAPGAVPPAAGKTEGA